MTLYFSGSSLDRACDRSKRGDDDYRRRERPHHRVCKHESRMHLHLTLTVRTEELMPSAAMTKSASSASVLPAASSV